MLSTLKVIYTQIPDTYALAQYFHCYSQIEDFEHLWLCPKNNPNLHDLVILHKSTFITHLKELNTFKDDLLIQEILSDNIWNSSPTSNDF